jgi:hypothetical protein
MVHSGRDKVRGQTMQEKGLQVTVSLDTKDTQGKQKQDKPPCLLRPEGGVMQGLRYLTQNALYGGVSLEGA